MPTSAGAHDASAARSQGTISRFIVQRCFKLTQRLCANGNFFLTGAVLIIILLAQVPEAAWLLHQLLEYAYTGPKPSKGLQVKVTECHDCVPSKFVALCGA